MIEHLDAVLRVIGRIGRYKDRFDAIIFHQLFQRRISLLATASLCQSRATLRNKIAYRQDLDIWMVLKSKLCAEFAYSVSHNPDAQLPIRYGFPAFRSVWVLRCSLETLYGFFR